MPRAYSYVRFSSTEQAKGDSLRRQTERAAAYCQRKGLVLDDALTLRDLGVSAFRGKNAAVGNFRTFLDAVKDGTVPAGSVLIVESFDRISRQGIDEGYDLIKSILKADVKIATLSPEREFDREATRSLSKGALEIQLILERAAEESERKSDRGNQNWQSLRKRAAADKTPVTSIVRGWLTVEGGKIVPIRDRAAVVRRVFKMVIAGHGMHAIATTLTSEGVPTFGKGRAWNPSILHKIVSTRAAVGEYQPRTGTNGCKKDEGAPIPGYYPTVVSEADWARAQAALSSRHNAGRQPAKGMYNPFSGMLYDARDGDKIYLAHSGNPKSNYVLVNYGAMYGKPGAVRVSFPLVPFIECVLATLTEVKVTDIIEDASGRTDYVDELEGKKFTVEERIAEVQAAMEEHGGAKSAIVSLQRLETQRDEWDAAIAAERQRIATPPVLMDCHSLIEVFRRNDTPETRARLKVVLRRLVSRVVCLFVARGRTRFAAVRIAFAGTARHRDLLIRYTQGSGNTTTKTPASWFVASDAWNAIGEEIDLTNTRDVATVEDYLLRV